VAAKSAPSPSPTAARALRREGGEGRGGRERAERERECVCGGENKKKWEEGGFSYVGHLTGQHVKISRIFSHADLLRGPLVKIDYSTRAS
jgi:hypothetical protein